MQKKNKQKKIILIAFVALALLALFFAFTQRGGSDASPHAQLQSAVVSSGRITQSVSATGHLQTGGGAEVSIPTGLTVASLYIEAGDIVTSGTALASFDMGSIQTQLANVSEALGELDQSIERERTRTQSRTITAGVSGTVEDLFASVGDSVGALMTEYGALLSLSVAGDPHPFAVMGASGRITQVHVSEGQAVRAGQTLFTLEETGHTQTYHALLAERNELAAAFRTLVQISETGTLLASFDGIVEGVHIGGDGSAAPQMPMMPNAPMGLPGFMGMTSATPVEAFALSAETEEPGDIPAETPPPDPEPTPTPTPEPSPVPTMPPFPSMPPFPTFPDFNMPAFPSFNMPQMPSFDMPTASQPSAHQTRAFTIAASDYMHLSVSVDERDILSLAVGQHADILLDALPGASFAGEIRRINVSGQTGGGGARYIVELILPRTDEMLPGMSAAAVIVTSESTETLILPVSAVQETDGRVYVYTNEARTNTIEITTGVSDGLLVEITDGLSEGAEVFFLVSPRFGFGPWGPGSGPMWGN